jgi:hypothetical protein
MATMSARDKYHDAVKNALIQDGWTITHDPYRIAIGRRRGYIDLGAEMPLAAEKQGRRIAVEVKSFLGASELDDLETPWDSMASIEWRWQSAIPGALCISHCRMMCALCCSMKQISETSYTPSRPG